MKFRQKYLKYAETVVAQPAAEGSHWLETFGIAHADSAYWLGRQLKHASGISNWLSQELARTVWRSCGEILEMCLMAASLVQLSVVGVL